MGACSGKCGREGTGHFDSGDPLRDMAYTWCDPCWHDLYNKRMPPGLAKDLPPGPFAPFSVLPPPPPPNPLYNSLAAAERKIMTRGVAEAKSAAAVATVAPPDATSSGEFTGYAATWRHQGGPDRQGDVIAPGAFTKWVGQVNSGAVVIPVVAGGVSGHSDAPMAVVGRVLEAGQDQTGLWIRASLSGDADAQLLRQKMLAGALSGLSIEYIAGKTGHIIMPDGMAARELDQVDVFHIALTGVPANPSARVTAVKGGAGTGLAGLPVPVVDIYADAQARHADPDQDRARREDAMLAAADWPPRDLPRDIRLRLLQGSAEAKAARAASEDEAGRRERERWERDNAYSTGLAEWMASHK